MEITDEEVFEVAIDAKIWVKEACEKLASLHLRHNTRRTSVLGKGGRQAPRDNREDGREDEADLCEMPADMERNHYNILRKQYDYINRYPDIYKEEFYDQLMKDINFNF